MQGDFSKVDGAIREFNRTQLAGFAAATGTAWIGLDGPVYRVGTARARALFVGPDGRHWGDATLVAESLSADPEVRTSYLERLYDPDLDFETTWIIADFRGRWEAHLLPLDEIARHFGLDAPVLMPETHWARSWWTLQSRTDAQEIAWIANGGPRFDRNEAQL